MDTTLTEDPTQDVDLLQDLVAAIKEGNVGEVERLIQECESGHIDLAHSTPCIATYVCNFEAVELLCNSSDLDLDATNQSGLTCLHVSVKSRDPRIVGHILQKAHEGRSQQLFSDFLNVKDLSGMTSLHHAAWEGQNDVVTQLLNYGDVDVNSQDEHGFTPLHFASWNNHLAVVNQLLQHPRINPQIQSRNVMGILGDEFVQNGKSDTIQMQIAHQEKILRDSICCNRPVRDSTHVGVFPMIHDVRCMLNGTVAPGLLASFYPDQHNAKVTALHCAAFAGHSKVVGALVLAISRTTTENPRKLLNVVDDHLMSPLHYAVIREDPSTVEELSTCTMVRTNQEEKVSKLTPLDMTLILIRQLDDSNFEQEYKIIKSLLLERVDVKRYIDSLYRDRQVSVEAVNAILVGAALIASITFAGWLQPPLGYRPYYEAQYLITGKAPPDTFDSYAAVEQHFSVQAFWIFNSLAFFFAVATVLTGAGAVLPSQDVLVKAEVEHIRTLLIRTSLMLGVSIFFVLGAFMAAGFASLPPTIIYQWGMIMTSGMGTSICLIVLCYYLKRLHRLFLFRNCRGLKKRVCRVWHVVLGHDSKKCLLRMV